MTLAGESAGAVYVHAHMAMGVPMRQAILQSGSLYLSPPISTEKASSIAATLENHLSLKSPSSGGELTLQTAPVQSILETLEDTGTVSLYLQTEPGLENWREKLGHARRLLIGDCEFEVHFSISFVCPRAYVRDPGCVSPKRNRNNDCSVHLRSLRFTRGGRCCTQGFVRNIPRQTYVVQDRSTGSIE